MARLTTAQVNAIAAGQPVRQAWDIQTPASSGSGSFTATSIHDDEDGPNLVIEAGTYTIEGYNASMKSPGRLTTGLYRIIVGNGDGKFSPETSGNYWYDTGGSYQASPFECRIGHSVKVLLLDGTWSEILYYTGKVEDVEFDDVKQIATISSVAMVVSDVLNRRWTADDGAVYDTSEDITATIPDS